MATLVQVGDAVEVLVGTQNLTGVVRFMGTTQFAEGEWVGIELDTRAGKNNGSVRGDVYFQCAPGYGIFVRPRAVAKRGGVSRASAPAVSRVRQYERRGGYPVEERRAVRKPPEVSVGSSSSRSSAYLLNQEEAAALKRAAVQAPSLKQKWENLQAEAARSKEEVAALQKKLKELQASEATSSRKAATETQPAEDAQASQASEDAATLEADKAAAAECKDSIHTAALNGCLPAMRHLLRDPERQEKVHGGPLGGLLHIAAARGHVDVVDFLLAKGAELEAKDGINGSTPLHRAAIDGHLAVVERLLAAGAAADAADKYGGTPLHFAAVNGHLAVVERLLAAGAAADAADNSGRTPLHRAAAECHLAVVERLLAAGAVLDAADNDGRTPYDIAQQEGHRQVMGVLKPVSVSLLSGRSCNCSSFGERTVSELKADAESRLGITITTLVGPDQQPLEESKTLEAAEILPGTTLTAIIAATEAEAALQKQLIQKEQENQKLNDELQRQKKLHQEREEDIKKKMAMMQDPATSSELPETLANAASLARIAHEKCGRLSISELAAVQMPKLEDADALGHIREMARDARRLAGLVVQVSNGILILSSETDPRPMIQPADEDSENKAPSFPKHYTLLGKIFKLQPEGTQFQEAVRLIAPREATANRALLSSGEGWKAVSAFFGTNYVEVTLPHFSWWSQCVCTGPVEPEQHEEIIAAPSRRADGRHRRHMFLSGRFNSPERVGFIKKVKAALEARGVPVEMVDVVAGQSFADPTMAGLFYAKVLVAFCTQDYGAKTGAGYETFHELRYAWEKALSIIAIQLSDLFPPEPPDEAGLIQNDFMFRSSTIRIDARKLAAEALAENLAETWQTLSR